MDGLAVGGHGGLLEGLGQGRVGVACAGNVLGRRAVLEGQGGLGDHLASVGTCETLQMSDELEDEGKHMTYR